MSSLPPGVIRRKIPLLLDLVLISNPALIRTLATHPEIIRPEQANPPALFRAAVYATQFYSPLDDQYSVAFNSDSCNSQPARRQRVFDQLNSCFTDSDIEKLTSLVRGNLQAPRFSHAVARVSLPRIIPFLEGDDHLIPEYILDAISVISLKRLSSSVTAYFDARTARKTVIKYLRETFPEEKYISDFLHDAVTAYHGFSAALLLLRDIQPGQNLETFMTQHPILPLTMRMPLQTTTLDGLFEDDPLVQGFTIIVLQLGDAAKKSEDINFVFGAGVEKRMCPFKQTFLETAERILQ